MNALATRIAAHIAANGPMPLEQYWNIALFDAEAGYYTTGEPFGAAGDFTTAPEISQMFGEMVAGWLVAAWQALGRPAPFTLAEIGPGRGTLMADILRSVRQIDPRFLQSAQIRMIEISDRLAETQQNRLSAFDLPIVWLRSIADLPAQPLLLVGNELFDAIAIRQLRFDGAAWRERLVGHKQGDGLTLVDGPPLADGPGAALPPPSAGDIFEIAPARQRLAAEIGRLIRQFGGAFLTFDYGHAEPAYGDTLQALRRHRFADPLAHPGEQDITAHVDFAALAAALGAAGIAVAPVTTQGQFLLALGLAERAGILGAERDAAGRAAIAAEAYRLAGTGKDEMGDLFKVLAAGSVALPLPPFN